MCEWTVTRHILPTAHLKIYNEKNIWHHASVVQTEMCPQNTVSAVHEGKEIWWSRDTPWPTAGLHHHSLYSINGAKMEILVYGSRGTGRNFRISPGLVWGAFGPSPKFIFKYVTCSPPKPDFLLFQSEWSPIYLQSALTIISLIHFSFMHKCQ
jgi:hypothetical protein